MLTYQQEKPKGGVGSHGVIIAAGAGGKNEENETKGEVEPGPGKRQGARGLVEGLPWKPQGDGGSGTGEGMCIKPKGFCRLNQFFRYSRLNTKHKLLKIPNSNTTLIKPKPTAAQSI